MIERTKPTPLLADHASLDPRSAAAASRGPSFLLMRGHQAILQVQPLLMELAARCGLSGEADSLEYFLSSPEPLKKSPCLLLIGGMNGCQAKDTGQLSVQSAVLLFEYQIRLRGTRIFSTADSAGRRNVLAAPGYRAQVAGFAARTLMHAGAQIVRIAFSEMYSGIVPQEPTIAPPAAGAAHASIAAELNLANGRKRRGSWTLAEDEKPLYLPLLQSFDETLARIGRRTRLNLRYYRRRAEQQFGSVFVPEVRISLDDFLRLNQECTYAVPDETAAWRFETARSMPGLAVSGVRDRDGRWLSLVGMRRNGPFVEIDWQMNRDQMPTASLATVMRSYLIEHEIKRGTERLYFEGGTPQPIGFSFLKERVGDLVVKKRSLYVAALERFAGRVVPPKNPLAQYLGNPAVKWTPW